MVRVERCGGRCSPGCLESSTALCQHPHNIAHCMMHTHRSCPKQQQQQWRPGAAADSQVPGAAVGRSVLAGRCGSLASICPLLCKAAHTPPPLAQLSAAGAVKPLPPGYTGLVLRPDTSSSSHGSDAEQRSWHATAAFKQLCVWNHDHPPAAADWHVRCIDWLGLAAQVGVRGRLALGRVGSGSGRSSLALCCVWSLRACLYVGCRRCTRPSHPRKWTRSWRACRRRGWCREQQQQLVRARARGASPGLAIAQG